MIRRLSNDVMMHLFSFLHPPDLRSLKLTCRFFRRLLLRKETWVAYLVSRCNDVPILEKKISRVETPYILSFEARKEETFFCQRVYFLNRDRFIGAMIGLELVKMMWQCNQKLDLHSTHHGQCRSKSQQEILCPYLIDILYDDTDLLSTLRMFRQYHRVDLIAVEGWETFQCRYRYLIDVTSPIREGLVEMMAMLGYPQVMIQPYQE